MKTSDQKVLEERTIEEECSKEVPFWNLTDMDKPMNIWLLRSLRLFQALFMTYNSMHPDDLLQTQVEAYRMVYGRDVPDIPVTWENMDQYRLRTGIFLYYLAIPFKLLKYLNVDYN